MLDVRDSLKPMSAEQIRLFLDDLSGWGDPYTCLVDVLRVKNLERSILVAGEGDVPELPDFSRCPIYPTRHTSWENADRYFLAALSQDDGCKYVASFNYNSNEIDVSRGSYFERFQKGNSFIRYIGRTPVFIFDKKAISIHDTNMIRENFYSPVVSLSDFHEDSNQRMLFESFLSMYCNIFDNETFLTLEYT